jgi:hypothetical protein
MSKDKTIVVQQHKWQYDICNDEKMSGRMGWFYRLCLRAIGTKVTKL